MKSCESNLIKRLQEVDHYLVHRFVGYNSLYLYALQSLKLTEHQALMYISVARKSEKLPQLQDAILSGELSVSKARRICSVINEDNQTEWVELAKTSSKRVIEKCIAEGSPQQFVTKELDLLTVRRWSFRFLFLKQYIMN